MAPEQPRLKPDGLRSVEHPRRKSMRKAPSKRRISEEGVEEGLERNHPGNPGKDRGQLPKASEGLRRCQRWLV